MPSHSYSNLSGSSSIETYPRTGNRNTRRRRPAFRAPGVQAVDRPFSVLGELLSPSTLRTRYPELMAEPYYHKKALPALPNSHETFERLLANVNKELPQLPTKQNPVDRVVPRRIRSSKAQIVSTKQEKIRSEPMNEHKPKTKFFGRIISSVARRLKSDKKPVKHGKEPKPTSKDRLKAKCAKGFGEIKKTVEIITNPEARLRYEARLSFEAGQSYERLTFQAAPSYEIIQVPPSRPLRPGEYALPSLIPNPRPRRNLREGASDNLNPVLEVPENGDQIPLALIVDERCPSTVSNGSVDANRFSKIEHINRFSMLSDFSRFSAIPSPLTAQGDVAYVLQVANSSRPGTADTVEIPATLPQAEPVVLHSPPLSSTYPSAPTNLSSEAPRTWTDITVASSVRQDSPIQPVSGTRAGWGVSRFSDTTASSPATPALSFEESPHSPVSNHPVSSPIASSPAASSPAASSPSGFSRPVAISSISSPVSLLPTPIMDPHIRLTVESGLEEAATTSNRPGTATTTSSEPRTLRSRETNSSTDFRSGTWLIDKDAVNQSQAFCQSKRKKD
ncbi:hypothetical protein BT63DRAFT_471615 [Microthyrium microscopicum]|uniref:Uncharacterized protein n=1 Tax=Microthyrium microscopicum TaxID=703497 RepID=A0A6A6U875_9PEZI|nr:hypothetical protein BT63DRAFT_471615 [Microthyrium microscopicum]